MSNSTVKKLLAVLLAFTLTACAVSGQVRAKTYVPGYWITTCTNNVCVPTYYPECWGLETTGGSTCVSKETYDRIPVGGYYTDEDRTQ